LTFFVKYSSITLPFNAQKLRINQQQIMLSIRLSRVGKKKQPLYRLIVTEKTRDPWGKFLENLGSYNPKTKVSQIKNDRILYWLKQGAQATSTVHNLLVSQGIIKDKKVRASKSQPGKKKQAALAAQKAQEKATIDAAKKAEAEAAKQAQEKAETAAPAEAASADTPSA